MMKRRIQTKRRKVRSGVWKTIQAKTTTRRTRKQRVAAGANPTADLGGESPNIGVARALLVILLLHVGAIAAIFVHSKVTSSGGEQAAAQGGEQEVTPLNGSPPPILDEGEEVPSIRPGSTFYRVRTGDTYRKIAKHLRVDEGVLRGLNGNTALMPGMALNVPGPDDVVEAEEEVALAGEEEMVAVEEVEEPEGEEAVGVVDSGRVYKVRSGDTIWSIARRLGVDRQDLLDLNDIRNPRHLQIGMRLKIPRS